MDLESGIIRWRAFLPQPSTQTDQPGNESGGSRKKALLHPWLWNRIFSGISVVSLLLVDPLFLYIIVYDSNKKCVDVDYNLTIFVCALRSVIDILYFCDVIFQFKWPLNFHGFLAIWAALPLPQVAFLLACSISFRIMPFPVLFATVLSFFSQFYTRFLKLGLYYIDSTRHSRLLPKNPGHGAAVNLLLCMLASNVLGALWYLGTLLDVLECWHEACVGHHCDRRGWHCEFPRTGDYSFLNSSCPLLEPNEIKQPSDFNFGMFLEALQSGLLEKQNRMQRIFYGFWWGLRNLSSLGQNIRTSNSIGETAFATAILITGLFLFAMVIHSIQIYAKSILAEDKRRQALRQDRNKIEQWMSSRMLPENLRHQIRELEIRSFKEDAVIRNFPKDLRREVTRHLCLDILTGVLMFVKMDDWLINALCDHLELVSFTKNKYICREGEPVDKMLFLTRGNILSTSTNGGRRTCVSIDLSKGYFWEEKLIPWALDPNSCSTLPASTTTVQSVKDVEGFALMAEDLRFLAYQFRRLNTEKVQHIFRFHSKKWRTWAACFIQAAWCYNRCKRLEKSLWENGDRLRAEVGTSTNPTATTSASNLSASAFHHQKPPEPDFGAETSRQ